MRFAIVFALSLLAVGVAADNSGRIYGKITTKDGDHYEGLIRWDRNEANWVDLLNGTKEIPRENLREARKDRKYRNRTRVKIFGIDLGENDGDWSFSGETSSEAAIRFGHIKKLIPERDDNILLVLKSGDTVEFTDGSTDFGSGMRELIIEDEREGETELTWDDIDLVELEPTPSGASSELGERMYGTLTTRRGDEFTGFVAWDMDECLGNDIIDGEEHGRSRKIKLGRMNAIARYSASGAEITLATGEDVILKGTNDVDNSNRGVAIEDPDLGEVEVDWHEFDKLTFKPAPKIAAYSDFSGGKPLHGTVTTEDGDTYTGDIRWDEDEASTWEILNGDWHNVTFRIEFGKVRKIEKESDESSTATLWDGRSFELKGSNDVDESNKGITIFQNGKKDVYVEWQDFRSVEFTK